MSLAARDILQARPNFAKHVLDFLFEHASFVGLKNEPYLYANHMLTRISYHALGIINKLPEPVSQYAPRVLRALRQLVRGPK